MNQSSPNKLSTAAAGGPPSLSFVCPQYAITYRDGCQLTVGDDAIAGTRCNAAPVSVAHLVMTEQNGHQLTDVAYDINVCPGACNREIFAIVRETESVDRVPRQRHWLMMTNDHCHDLLAGSNRPCTYPL
jgi:hypothetical protein